ncbi:tyrosine-type recombinase/integrase [Prescottella agglutinans]|uniref:Integrase n=1 Tax=Prescottella agglutinans TaxID=1644129 RepID=A0ABT6MG35_9NOCA|nr:site-specific integrase [Prescottella agglutinans]MDH6283277.1 integrase [Prescottella agglutinans]
MTRRSRRAGKGSITSYTTKAGTRWRYQLWVPVDPEHPDAGLRQTGKAGYATAADADDALTKAKNDAAAGLKAGTEKVKLGPYAQTWLDGHRVANSTREQYQRHITLHIEPHLGDLAIRAVTASRIAKFYRDLETAGLGTNTIRKIHVTLTQILDAAVSDRHVLVNRARDKHAKPPTVKQAKEAAEEFEAWTAQQLSAFLAWDRDVYTDELHPLWHLLAFTGARRGEALALRWSDVDLKEGRITIRRALDSSQAGKGEVKGTKTGRTRVVDIDAATVEVLKSHRGVRGGLSLGMARGDALVFGNDAGEPRNVRSVSGSWNHRVRKAQAKLGADTVPDLKLHGLRHTHATLLIQAGESMKVVQDRLGHASITITMDVYAHVLPGAQKSAADRFASLLG